MFDPDNAKSVLRSEMAKKNMYIKNTDGDLSKRVRAGPGTFQQQQFPGYSFGPFPGFHAAAQPTAYHGLPQHFGVGDPYGGPYSIAPQPGYGGNTGGYGGMGGASSGKDNPPCNTLFIGNLSQDVSEQELAQVMAAQLGFSQLKVLRQAQNSVCFVEFVDVDHASQCHTRLQVDWQCFPCLH